MAIDKSLINSMLDNLKTAILRIENMDVSMETILNEKLNDLKSFAKEILSFLEVR